VSPDEQIFIAGIISFILIFSLIMITVYWINSKDEHRSDLVKRIKEFFNNISSPLTRALLIGLVAVSFLVIIEAIWWSSQTGRYEFIDDFYDSQSGDYQIFDTSKGVLHQCNYFEDESADECETPFKN